MTTSWRRRWLLVLPSVGIAAVANYVAWLGWDQHRDVHADGSSTGPYTTWQVLGLVAMLASLAWMAGRDRLPLAGSFVISTLTAVSFAVDASNDPESDGLWPIGAFLVLLATFAGSLLVALLATRAGQRHHAAAHDV